jgi:spermidine synthase
VVWTRQFGLIFGVTSYAIGAVLSAFFAGLALGSWLVGRWMHSSPRSTLRLYSLLELGIVLYALMLPWLLSQFTGLYATLFPSIHQSFYLLSLLRFVGAVLVLLIPATCMGATLPLMAQALADKPQNITINVSGLYAINTLGALIGAAFSGFYAIGTFGMAETTLLAVIANVIAAVGAQALAHHFSDNTSILYAPPIAETSPSTAVRGRKLILLSLFLSGFAALGYEVVWTRVLSIFLDRTVIAFTTILCSVLLGIVVGSWLLRASTARIRRPIWLFAVLELSVALLNLLAIALIGSGAIGRMPNAVSLQLGLILVIPNALLGATLPLAVRIYQTHRNQTGQDVSQIYASNVLGGVLGSFAASFLLLPLFGSQHTIVILALINAVIAWLLFQHSETIARWKNTAWIGVTISLAAVLILQPQLLFRGINQTIYTDQQLIFHEEDIEGIVTVTEKASVRSIYFDGTLEAEATIDSTNVHRRLAHLPLLLHPNPESVLVIGLGSGTTAGTVTQHPVKQIKVVELIPGMARGAQLFAQSNYNLLDDPRVQLQIDDGRNYLALGKDSFDIIEADVIHPHRVGANNIYAAEYYRLVATHLKPQGIVCQWLPTYLSEDKYKLLLRTFVSAFPNTTLWAGGEYAVAMPDGVTIDETLLRSRFSDPKLAPVLAEAGYTNLDTLLRSFTMGPQAIQAYVGEGPILTDNHPYLEYLPAQIRQQGWRLDNQDITRYLKR